MNAVLAAAAIAILLLPRPGNAGWIESALEPSCSNYSRSRVAAGTRRQIEFSVRRAEASLQPPEPVSELSCLDRLMDTRIDQFAPTGSLNSIFFDALDGIANLPGQAAQRICSLAQESWNEVTRPLDEFGFESGDAIPPDYISRFGLANFPKRHGSGASVKDYRRNDQGAGDASGFNSGGSKALSGGASAANGYDPAGGNELGYGSRTGEYFMPGDGSTGSANTESTLINEIWKSLYGG